MFRDRRNFELAGHFVMIELWNNHISDIQNTFEFRFLILVETTNMFSRFPVFLVGSVLGAAIDYLVTLLASSLLGINPLIALALSMIISGSFVFYFHLRVTFEDTQGQRFRKYVVFMAWTGVIYILRALLLEFGIFMGLPLAVALAVAIGLASIINFAFSSVFVFAKRQS